jgi:hypothetical protein
VETWVGEEGRGATPVEINEHVDAIIGDDLRAQVFSGLGFVVCGLGFMVWGL